MDNSLQSFYVLHKSPAPAKSRKKVCSHLSSSFRSCHGHVAPVAEDRDELLSEAQQFEDLSFLWLDIEMSIKAILKRVNSVTFDKVTAWICDSFHTSKRCATQEICSTESSYLVPADNIGKRMDTALLLTKNVELADDTSTFEELAEHLKSHGHHVAMLSSSHLTTKGGVGSCIRVLLSQLTNDISEAADLVALASWYSEITDHSSPIVIIVSDVERGNAAVLAEFMSMIREWALKIPLIFIMGVTAVDAVMKFLPIVVLQRLHLCAFELMPTIEKIDAIIEEIFVKNWSGIHIGNSVAAFLKRHFLMHDGTVSCFIKAIKTVYSKHYFMQPLSFLAKCLLADNQDFLKEKCRLLPDIMLKNAFNMPSCGRYKISEKTGDKLAHELLRMKESQKIWSVVVMCLYKSAKFHDIHLLDIFCDALNPKFCYSIPQEYTKEGSTISLSSSSATGKPIGGNHFVPIKDSVIAQIIEKVRDLSLLSLHNLVQSWAECTNGVTGIHQKVNELLAFFEVQNSRTTLNCEESQFNRHFSGGLHAISESSLSVVHEEAVILLKSMVKDHLTPLEHLPFHEIFCFTNAEMLQSALSGDPRGMVQLDLQKHDVSLCCTYSREDMLVSMLNDTSAMFNLAQEHGDLINLHDWYESFKAAITNKHKLPSRIRQTDKMVAGEASLQARFCRAVLELQIIGILRMPSKKRPDFLQRAVFGV